jgi:acyl-coenzyme A synthetase/AMP-(fatty) acid ligase
MRRTDPDAVALVAGEDGGSLTYGILVDRIDRTAAGLRDRGIGPGGRVAIAAPLGIDGVVAYLGVQAAGAAAVMLYPRSPVPELEARLAAVNPICSSPAPASPCPRVSRRPALPVPASSSAHADGWVRAADRSRNLRDPLYERVAGAPARCGSRTNQPCNRR